MTASLDDAMRQHTARVLASLIRWSGSFDLAEEALADAQLAAVERLDPDIDPEHLGAWLLTTARHRAIDRIRRERLRPEKEADAMRLLTDGPEERTDLLRLVFTCCHPALSSDAQVALALRVLCGLSTAEIARAFLVSDATMGQRIARAKRKIARTQIPYRVPPDDQLPDRLDSVLRTVYIVYATGHHAPLGAATSRVDLAHEASRMSRLLVDLMPDEAEAHGLLALILATEARRPGRVGPDGELVRLQDQDRRRWDQDLIAEASLHAVRALGPAGYAPYGLQAAIACLHSTAATWADTDWAQIAYLYQLLDRITPTPVVRVNRAIAEAEVFGPAAALETLDTVDADRWHLCWMARGEMHERLGDSRRAAECFDAALALEMNHNDRAELERRRDAIRSR